MHALRFLTLLWPGLPWLWLRGSLSGLVLALAFAVSLDMALVTGFIWPGLVEVELSLGLWGAVAAVWLVSTVSAVSAFPPAIAVPRPGAADALFVRARDAYLARDWLQAEARLEELLGIAPTDGEAQLLHATLLRRTGRVAAARKALEKLARSDSGGIWRGEIAAELQRLSGGGSAAAVDEPRTLSLHDESAGPRPRSAAA